MVLHVENPQDYTNKTTVFTEKYQAKINIQKYTVFLYINNVKEEIIKKIIQNFDSENKVHYN